MKCKICGGEKTRVVYCGHIRGEADTHFIYECGSCFTQFLDKPNMELFDYQSGEYRERVGDDELARHIPDICVILPPSTMHGAVHVDVGSSDGGYLNFAGRFTSQSFGIEPSADNTLPSQFTTFSSLDDAMDELAGKVDIITCWHVIEHVENPVDFLREMGELLKDKGKLYLSTPNRDEVLMRLLNTDYAKFFYRAWHNFYFDECSLESAANFAGLKMLYCHYGHSFGLGNTLGWLRDKQPCGAGLVLGEEQETQVDIMWKAWMEALRASDTLYMSFTREVLQ